MAKFWLSSKKMTVFASLDGNRIVDTSPITKVFLDQRFLQLVSWMKKQGGFRMVRLDG